MLWTLLRIVIFVAIVGAITYGIGQLSASGESVRIAFGNTEFNLGPLQSVIAAILLLAAVWIILKLVSLLVALLRFVTGDETAVQRYFSQSRERRGYRALVESLTALAGGEGKEAQSRAKKAERLLKRPDLTDLMRAQAAEMSGDRDEAVEAYKRLLADDRTRFVGVRGLMKQKLAQNESETALKLAEKAFVLKPKNDEVSDTLLRLQAKHANWKGARKTLGAKLKYGSMPRDVHKRRDAVLAVSEAQHRLAAGDLEGARDEAIEAQRLAPTLVPASVMAARAYIELDKPRNAAKVLRTAWGTQPHPDIAAVFAEIVPNETPQERVERFEELTKQKPQHSETRMLRAELLIAAEDFPAARKALGDLAESDPTARSLTLMAAVERGQGADDTTVKAWLAKALTASRGTQWICDKCGQIHRDWIAVCGNCDGFDTLSWRRAPDAEMGMGSSEGMLPLIVGGMGGPPAEAAGDGGPEVVEAVAGPPAHSGSGPEPKSEAKSAPKPETQSEGKPETKSAPQAKETPSAARPGPAAAQSDAGASKDGGPAAASASGGEAGGDGAGKAKDVPNSQTEAAQSAREATNGPGPSHAGAGADAEAGAKVEPAEEDGTLPLEERERRAASGGGPEEGDTRRTAN